MFGRVFKLGVGLIEINAIIKGSFINFILTQLFINLVKDRKL